MRYIIILSAILSICCNGEQNRSNTKDTIASADFDQIPSKTKMDYVVLSTPNNDSITSDDKKHTASKLKVYVIQCSNGYVFAMGGYDFNPIIEKELKSKENIELIPFDAKKLLEVTYQGVYDKKYCKPIMEKIKADYFIMTRFIGPHPDTPNVDSVSWGYETKILNIKTMEQKVSIGKTGLKEYQDIESHIKKNIDQLVKDLEVLK